MTSPSLLGTFRGIEPNRLVRLIESACAGGRIVLMKHANVTQNLGKDPALVLAEMLILALKEEEMGAQYDD